MSLLKRLRRVAVPKAVARPLRTLPVLILLGLAVHLLLPQLATLEQSLSLVRQMALLPMGLALLAQVLSAVGLGVLLRGSAGIMKDQLPLWRATVIGTTAADVGLVAGGAVGNAAAVFRWTRASGCSREGALLAATLPSLFNNLLLAAIAVAGLGHLLVAHELTTPQVIAFALILLVLTGIVGALAYGMRHRSALSRFAQWASARWARLRGRTPDPSQTEGALERLYATSDAVAAGGWRGPLLGAALNTGFDMLTLYLVFVAAGHRVSPGVLLAGYGLPLLLGKVGFPPGGVGLVDGTMAALYEGLNVPSPVTVVVILTYRAMSFWLPTLIGLLMLPYLQHVTRRRPLDRSTG